MKLRERAQQTEEASDVESNAARWQRDAREHYGDEAHEPHLRELSRSAPEGMASSVVRKSRTMVRVPAVFK